MHTPTPWIMQRYNDESTSCLCAGEGDIRIASMECGTEEDAALIVKAVNSYEAMKKACEAALANISPMYSSNHHVVKLLTKALAEGKE